MGVPWEKRARRYHLMREIPPRRCTAHRSDKQPCKKWAMFGAEVCDTHGGKAKQVRAKAEERITLAERLKVSPRRQPWEVMEDVAHVGDVLYQDARVAIEHGGVDVEKLVASLERAHRLSNANVTTGLAERKQRFAEGQAMEMHRVFTRVLSGLGLTAEQMALVPALLRREIEGVVTKQIEGRAA